MNLVVDDVEDEIVDHAGILTERGDGLEESLPRYLRPQRVELLGGVIPQPEDLCLRPRVTVGRSRPFAGDDAIVIISSASAPNGRMFPAAKLKS